MRSVVLQRVAAIFHYSYLLSSFLPETKGCSLEEIDILFGGVKQEDRDVQVKRAQLGSSQYFLSALHYIIFIRTMTIDIDLKLAGARSSFSGSETSSGASSMYDKASRTSTMYTNSGDIDDKV